MENVTPGLSIIIPAYNEEQSIRTGKLRSVVNWMQAQSFPTELIVVDDQSQDQTAAMAADYATRVIKIQHAGKAAAVIAGIRGATQDWALFTDMDQATPITETHKLLTALQSGAEIAAGSRGLIRRGAPVGRYVLSYGQVILKYLLLGLFITDTQCGFKAFNRCAALDVIDHLVVYNPSVLGTLHGPSVTSGFDVEFLMVAARLGYAVKEVPVTWDYQQTRRVSLLRDSLRGLRDLQQIATARLVRKYPRRMSRRF